MKKICLLLLSLVLMFSFAACTNTAAPSDDGAQTANGNLKSSKFVFQVAGAQKFEIKMDQNMADVLSALGEPTEYFEAASCAFEGLDKTYTYAGFIVTTRPDGAQDFVNSVRLTDDSVTTPEGVYVGATADDVRAKYGDPAEQTETLLKYADGNATLNFTLEGGKVVSIEYLPA